MPPSAPSPSEGDRPEPTAQAEQVTAATAQVPQAAIEELTDGLDGDSGEAGNIEPAEPQPRSETFLRERLGLNPLGWTLAPAVRLRGWVVTAVVTVVAALTRLISLSHPHSLMFDEIYYVKDAYALWHNGYESTWKDGADALFAKGTSQP